MINKIDNNMKDKINKGLYYVFFDCRGCLFEVEKVMIGWDNEEELVSKLLMVKGESKEEVVKSYYINNKGDMSFDDIVKDIIEDEGNKEFGYMLNEELCGVSEEMFNEVYKKEYNKEFMGVATRF